MTKDQKEQLSKVTQKIRERKGYDLWKVQLWLQTKNPNMGDISPIEAILSGKFESLWKFIDEGVWEK